MALLDSLGVEPDGRDGAVRLAGDTTPSPMTWTTYSTVNSPPYDTISF
jgi:hypothetical protein